MLSELKGLVQTQYLPHVLTSAHFTFIYSIVCSLTYSASNDQADTASVRSVVLCIYKLGLELEILSHILSMECYMLSVGA